MSDQTGAAAPIVTISDSTFTKEVTQAGTPVLIDFMADWCRPCKIMEPIFAQLAPEYAGRVKFVRINADDNPQAVSTMSVLNLPTFVLVQGDRVLAQNMGTMKAPALKTWIEDGLAKSARSGSR